MSLLVAPLYGDKPECGIRELIQNALDACRELNDLRNSGVVICGELREQVADVVVELAINENGSATLSIKDRGIGMTPKIVNNYFLCAGASFRKSDIWRRQHADEGNQSRVLRSGRFGIGVLAAFLLGSELEVWTRHALAQPEEGVHFRCTLEDEIIELNRSTLPVGTLIRTQIDSKEIVTRLSSPEKYTSGPQLWDWYCLDGPEVKRFISRPDGTFAELRQSTHLPDEHDALPLGWHRLNIEGFRDVHWSYINIPREPYHFRDNALLVCNGLLVGEMPGYRLSDDWHCEANTATRFSEPNLNVFDPDGRLPLNLQRTDLASDLPFEKELLREVVKDFLAFLVVNLPEEIMSRDGDKPMLAQLKWYAGLESHMDRWAWSTPDGWSILDNWNVITLAPPNIILDFTSADGTTGAWQIPSLDWKNGYYAMFPGMCDTRFMRERFARWFLRWDGDFSGLNALNALLWKGSRFILTKGALHDLKASREIPKSLFKSVDIETEHGNLAKYI